MGDDGTPEQGHEDKPREIYEPAERGEQNGMEVLGCLQGIVWLASPVLLYFGLVWLFGLWPNPAVAWYFYLFAKLGSRRQRPASEFAAHSLQKREPA